MLEYKIDGILDEALQQRTVVSGKSATRWTKHDTQRLYARVLEYYRYQGMDPLLCGKHEEILETLQKETVPRLKWKTGKYLAKRQTFSKWIMARQLKGEQNELKKRNKIEESIGESIRESVIGKITQDAVADRVTKFMDSILTPEFKISIEKRIDNAINASLGTFDKEVLGQIAVLKNYVGMIVPEIVPPKLEPVAPLPPVNILPAPVKVDEQPVAPLYVPVEEEDKPIEDDNTDYGDSEARNDHKLSVAVLGVMKRDKQLLEQKIDLGHRSIEIDYYAEDSDKVKVPILPPRYDHVFVYLADGIAHKISNRMFQKKDYEQAKQVTVFRKGSISSLAKAIVQWSEQAWQQRYAQNECAV